MKNKFLTFILVVATILSVSGVAMADESGLPNDCNGVITLNQDVALNAAYNVSGDITIEGNGYTITWAAGYTGTLFNIESSSSLTLNKVVIDGENKFNFYNGTTDVEDGENWYTRFVKLTDEDKTINDNVIVNNGSLALGEGTAIKNVTIASDTQKGKTENNGSGYVLKYNDDLAIIRSNGGVVNLSGANITGNAGLILNAINTKTTMNGATIDSNMGCGNKGGIIIADKGSMVIDSETSISLNKAMARSATILGVINGAEVTFSGTMNNNKHIGVGGNTAGAMVVLEGASQFVMAGGSISGNVGGRAGAVASRWVKEDNQHEGTSIILNSGTISGNTAKKDDWDNAAIFLRSPAVINEGMNIEGDIVVNASPAELGITGGTVIGKLTVASGLTANISGGRFSTAPDSSLIVDGKVAANVGKGTDRAPFTIESGVESNGITVVPAELDFGSAVAGYSSIDAKTVYIYGANMDDNYAPTATSDSSDYDVSDVEKIDGIETSDGKTEGYYKFTIKPKDGLSAGAHNASFTVTASTLNSPDTNPKAAMTVNAAFTVTASGSTSTGSGISLWYNGGNSFGSSKSAVPTSVEIDGTPVSFTGDGSSFTVSCVKADAKWVTVRWNSTTVTANFTPDARAACAAVAIPKTGDMPIWAAIAEFFGF